MTNEQEQMLKNQPKPSQMLRAFIQGRAYERYGVPSPSGSGDWAYPLDLVDNVPVWLADDARVYLEAWKIWRKEYDALLAATVPPLRLALEKASAKVVSKTGGAITEVFIRVPRDQFDELKARESEEVVYVMDGGAVHLRPHDGDTVQVEE